MVYMDETRTPSDGAGRPSNAGIHVINTAHFGMPTPEVLQDDDPIDDAPDAPATSQMSKRAMLRDLRRR